MFDGSEVNTTTMVSTDSQITNNVNTTFTDEQIQQLLLQQQQQEQQIQQLQQQQSNMNSLPVDLNVVDESVTTSLESMGGYSESTEAIADGLPSGIYQTTQPMSNDLNIQQQQQQQQQVSIPSNMTITMPPMNNVSSQPPVNGLNNPIPSSSLSLPSQVDSTEQQGTALTTLTTPDDNMVAGGVEGLLYGIVFCGQG